MKREKTFGIIARSKIIEKVRMRGNYDNIDSISYLLSLQYFLNCFSLQMNGGRRMAIDMYKAVWKAMRNKRKIGLRSLTAQ